MNRSQADVTAQVRDLYETYPFPGPYASAAPPTLDATMSYTWVCYRALGQYRTPAGRLLLDAGCGSGETLRRYAANNPGMRLVGYDVSQASLDLARTKLAALPGVDFVLERRDLLELPAPTLRFDLISCTGVLHHLADPLRGLRNLRPYLKADGLFSIYLYPEYARREINMVARILRLLCEPGEPLAARVQVARQLIGGLPPKHFLIDYSRFGFDTLAFIERDEHLADMFLHPQEIDYTYEQVIELLDAADLELVCFYDSAAWDLERLLPGAELVERARRLSLHEQRILADLLNPRSAYIFLAGPKGRVQPPPRSLDDLPLQVPVLSPITSLTQTRPMLPLRNIAPETYVEVHETPPRRYRLDPLSEAVLGWIDGRRTAGQVAASVAAQDKGGRVDAMLILAQIANLEREGVLMLARPHELVAAAGG
jgi:SAM-dependent methyltransferase